MRGSAALIFFLAVATLFLIPFGFLIYGSLVPSINSNKLTLSFLTSVFSPANVPLLLNTLEFGAGGALLGLAITIPYVWLVSRTDVPGKRYLKLLALFPLAMPHIVDAFAYIFLFSPKIGLVNFAVMRVFGLTNPPFNIYSMAGLIYAWGIGGLPYAYLLLEPSFRSVDPALEEAARSSGSSPLGTFRRVTLPLVRPAIIATFVLNFLPGIENFDFPFLLGRNIQTLATKVYFLVSVNGQYSQAAAYSMLFFITTLIVVTIYILSIGKSFKYHVVTGSASPRIAVRLGAWKWAGLAYCLGVLLFAFILPFGIMFMVSLVPFYTVGPNINPFAVLTLDSYVKMFHLSLFQRALTNTLVISISAALVATLVGSLMAYVLIKSKAGGKRILEYISYLPLAFPDTVYGLAIIWTFALTPIISIFYGTYFLLILAMIVIFLPFAIRFGASVLLQISNELQEASQVSGASWPRTLISVILPLMKSALLNSFVMIMLSSMRNLGAAILLTTGSSVVLTVLMVSLYEGSPSALPVVAAVSVVLVLIIAAVVFVTSAIQKRGIGEVA